MEHKHGQHAARMKQKWLRVVGEFNLEISRVRMHAAIIEDVSRTEPNMLRLMTVTTDPIQTLPTDSYHKR